jgi:hypothetical protein
LEEAIRKAKYVYEQSKGRSNFQKAWDDIKKGKMDHINKGFKPPFVSYNSQVYQQGQSLQG